MQQVEFLLWKMDDPPSGRSAHARWDKRKCSGIRVTLEVAVVALLLAVHGVAVPGCTSTKFESKAIQNDRPVEFPPRSYDVPYSTTAPVLDGQLDENAWARAPWSSDFGDIQGSSMPAPRFRTRMKMLWDAKYLYVGAEMEEPQLWATYDQHDQIVFHEHDFEIFIDPIGDAREYYEIEVNVLGTIFDLFLYTTYRDGGPADHGWDCAGLKSAIHVDGTVNDPRDTDSRWVLEWAIPFAALTPPGSVDGPEASRGGRPPKAGETWRINFSRVQWQLLLEDGSYVKRPQTPEDNWTWTPQWEINMHVPQHWGYVRFMPAGKVVMQYLLPASPDPRAILRSNRSPNRNRLRISG